jgi:hypothetical protein
MRTDANQILMDMNKEVGKQSILITVIKDLSMFSHTKKYKQYQVMLEESEQKYDELKNELNNIIK